MVFEDYYSIIGVPFNATAEQVRRAYRARAMQWHPDRNPNLVDATERMQTLNRAGAVLMEPERRRAYDVQWRRQRGGARGHAQRRERAIRRRQEARERAQQRREAARERAQQRREAARARRTT